MDRQHNERTERLRAVLRKMERSIEDARSRRETTNSTDPTPAERMDPNRSSLLDTPIIGNQNSNGNGNGNSPSQQPPARTHDSMFDFDAPRLKARPKRRPAV